MNRASHVQLGRYGNIPMFLSLHKSKIPMISYNNTFYTKKEFLN